MALSTTAKVGIGSSLSSLGAVSLGTYLGKDYIFYYEVERELINRNILLSVKDLTKKEGTIVIEAQKNTNETIEANKLPKDYSWSCEIVSITENESVSLKAELNDKLSNLSQEKKADLVKACSGNRKDGALKTVVVGQLKATKVSQDYSFEKHKNLNYLLTSQLKAVEKEVINKEVKFSIPDPNTNNPILVKAEASTNETAEANKLSKDHSWSCEITVVPENGGTLNGEVTKIVNKLKEKLPTNSATDHKENRILLVKACSKKLKDGSTATDNSVTRQLKIIVKGNETKSYKFEHHSELQPLLEGI